MLEVWREAALNIYNQLEAWTDEAEGHLYVNLNYFWMRNIVEDNRSTIPPVRKMVGNARAAVERACPVEFPVKLEKALYVTDFNALQSKTPFQINISGFVLSVDEERTSESGNPVKSFRLQDQTGRYVQCTVVGRHVDNQFLREKNNIIIYFARGQEGLSGHSGQLWVFENCHIVCLGSRTSLPAVTSMIELR